MVLNTVQRGPFRPTVSSGRFAAWWPGPTIRGMEEPGPEPTLTVTVRDGTTRADLPMAEVDVSPPG